MRARTVRKISNAGANVTVKEPLDGSTGSSTPSSETRHPEASGGRTRETAARGSVSGRKAAERQNPDPLFVIFEQHLLNFQDPEIDRKTFIAKVVDEYLGMLRQKNITVPKSLEQPIVEELATQVNAMLVKRIYGSSTIAEFRARHVKIRRRRTSPAAKRKADRTA